MPNNSSEVHIDHFDVAAERAKALKTLNNSRNPGVECFPAALCKRKESNFINQIQNSSSYYYYKNMGSFRVIFSYQLFLLSRHFCCYKITSTCIVHVNQEVCSDKQDSKFVLLMCFVTLTWSHFSSFLLMLLPIHMYIHTIVYNTYYNNI